MKVLTAKGKIYDYAWCGVAFTGDFVIGLQNAEITDIMRTFTNREETAELTLYRDDDMKFEESVKVITGYTRFVGVRIDIEGTTNVTLGREYAE